MSLKLGTQDIAGISQNTKYNAHHLLDFKWTDCIMNDVSWLRADTFSWQSGGVYVTAYNHLVADISGITAETETIGSYTVTFYRATDGHKIVLADQETTIVNIYSETGIAWYYILDTTNTRFKLPRTKWGFTGLRDNVGNYVEPGLPNITGSIQSYNSLAWNKTVTASGAFSEEHASVICADASGITGAHTYKYNFDASNSNSIYGNSPTVQSPTTQMYLYFYVGDYSQTAIEQTAGLNSELFNGKADVDLTNCTKPHIVETYVNGTSWYRVYSDGWCEQGGEMTSGADAHQVITFLKEFSNTNYYFNRSCYINNSSGTSTGYFTGFFNKTVSSVTIQSSYYTDKTVWRACGYIS